MKIITRKEWGARPFRNGPPTVPLSSRREVTIHYPGAGTPPKDAKSYAKWIERIHMDQNGWRGVGYNYFVDAYGNVAEGCGRDVQGAHSPPHNYDGIGVNIWTSNGVPTDAGKRAARELYDLLCKQSGRKLRIGWHGRDYATACPGPHLIAWCKAGMPVIGKTPSNPTDPAKDWFDMATQKDLEKAVRSVLNEELIPTTDHYPASKKGKRHSVLGVLRRMWAVAERDANSRYRQDRKDMAALKASLKALGKKVGLSDADLDAVQKAAETGAEKGAGDALDEMIDGATVTLEVKE